MARTLLDRLRTHGPGLELSVKHLSRDLRCSPTELERERRPLLVAAGVIRPPYRRRDYRIVDRATGNPVPIRPKPPHRVSPAERASVRPDLPTTVWLAGERAEAARLQLSRGLYGFLDWLRGCAGALVWMRNVRALRRSIERLRESRAGRPRPQTPIAAGPGPPREPAGDSERLRAPRPLAKPLSAERAPAGGHLPPAFWRARQQVLGLFDPPEM